jgi:hypothetical protein
MALLNTGADPWIRGGDDNETAFERLNANYIRSQEMEMVDFCWALELEHEPVHLLHKVRNLCDAARDLAAAKAHAAAPRGGTQQQQQQQQQAAKYVPPPYVKRRVEKGWQLPSVLLTEARPETEKEKEEKEKLMAVIEFVLGGGEGGEVKEGEKGQGEGQGQGLLKELFFELIDMVSPRWDPKRIKEEGEVGDNEDAAAADVAG